MTENIQDSAAGCGAWRVAPEAMDTHRPGPEQPSETAAGQPLQGLRVAVKDLYAVQGHPVGAGNPAYLAQQQPEPEHAWAVAALLRSGASLEGIAHTDEFAYSIAGRNQFYGTPCNGLHPERIPGGSSSGSATVVALGQAEIGLGTDTGGSIRVPAAYQGLYGLRTSHGLLPSTGLLPLAPDFDTIGWLTRDAQTLEAVATALVQEATGLPAGGSERPPVRRILMDEALLAQAEEDVAAALHQLLHQWCHVPGTELETVRTGLAWHLDEWAEAFRISQAAQAWRHWGPWVQEHPQALTESGTRRFHEASRVSAAEEREARRTAERARREIRVAVPFGAALAIPAAATVAPALGATARTEELVRRKTMRITCLGGLSGLPVATAPARTASGLGAGLGLMGSWGTDVELTQLLSRTVARAATDLDLLATAPAASDPAEEQALGQTLDRGLREGI